MNVKLTVTAAALATFIFFFLTATAAAQPIPDGWYPSEPDYPGPDYPSGPDYSGSDYPSEPDYPGPDYPSGPDYPGQDYPSGPDYPESQSGTSPSDGEEDHPAVGPSSMQPMSTPSGSNTEALNYAEGQVLSQQEVSSGGTMAYYMATTGLQVWTRYNGIWTTDSASIFYYRSTSLLSYNDQSQRVWSWERYPNGQVVWHNLGYRMPGYFHGRFIGDAHGWHELAMWGSRSGWSNVVWIYVW